MKTIIIITFSLVFAYVAVGQSINDNNSSFYYDYFKLLPQQNINIKNSDYKVFGNHDGFYLKPFNALLWFYKKLLSDQLSSDCSFTPSCSRFSYQAIHEFGLFKGIFITADRLTRCNGNANLESPSYLFDNQHAKIKDIPVYYRASE